MVWYLSFSAFRRYLMGGGGGSDRTGSLIVRTFRHLKKNSPDLWLLSLEATRLSMLRFTYNAFNLTASFLFRHNAFRKQVKLLVLRLLHLQMTRGVSAKFCSFSGGWRLPVIGLCATLSVKLHHAYDNTVA